MEGADNNDERNGGAFKVFVRVAQLTTPVAVLLQRTSTVAELRRLFLSEYADRLVSGDGNSPSTEAAPLSECRLVCRGKELLDHMNLLDLVRPGDHLHAIVREVEPAHEQQQVSSSLLSPQPVPSTNSIRAGAQSFVEGLSRLMQAREAQQQREQEQSEQQFVESLRRSHSHLQASPSRPTVHRRPDRIPTIVAGSSYGTVPPPGPPPPAEVGHHGSHQQVIRLAGDAPSSAPSPTMEFGGIDGQSEVVADTSLLDTTNGVRTLTLSSASLVQMMTSISEAPTVFLCGMCGGYFTGFIALFFIFAKEIRPDFRYGCAAGLALNVFLAMMLPHVTMVPFRTTPH